MIPAVEGLLPEPHNRKLMTLVFRIAEWHALAKLRMHTENTLNHLDEATANIGQELRAFREWTREYRTVELPHEVATRQRRKSKKDATKQTSGLAASPTDPPLIGPSGGSPDPPPNPPTSSKPNEKSSPLKTPAMPKLPKVLNLLTYKVHALGDYVQTIRMFGTTDSYSTQIV
jgi:hypothetical protein